MDYCQRLLGSLFVYSTFLLSAKVTTTADEFSFHGFNHDGAPFFCGWFLFNPTYSTLFDGRYLFSVFKLTPIPLRARYVAIQYIFI